MPQAQQPEALRLADALAYCESSVAAQAARELRSLHAQLEAAPAATPPAPSLEAAAILEAIAEEALINGNVYAHARVTMAANRLREAARAEAATPPAQAAAKEPTPITFMTVDQACKWGWEDVRKEVGTEGWTVMDSVNYHGFFLWGWNYRGQYELQRAATRSAVIQEIMSAAPAASASQAQDVQRDADIQRAVLAERERICAAIKAEDDHCVTQGDYMLDSEDCIKVVRGEWVRPVYEIGSAASAAQKGGA